LSLMGSMSGSSRQRIYLQSARLKLSRIFRSLEMVAGTRGEALVSILAKDLRHRWKAADPRLMPKESLAERP
jgi:hypothetical protein